VCDNHTLDLYHSEPLVKIYNGNALECLRLMPAESVNCCVTSPPYWGLRDYGTAQWEGGSTDCDHRADGERRQIPHGDGRKKDSYTDNRVLILGAGANFKDVCGRCGAKRVDQQLGLEHNPEDYATYLTAIFEEVRRVLKNDGTLWLNLGDCYNAYNGNRGRGSGLNKSRHDIRQQLPSGHGLAAKTLKPKDLVGIPWLVAFSLRAAGWYLRCEIIWHKPNPMPESVEDRPTKAHETLFLLSKRDKYYYDAAAIAEPSIHPAGTNRGGSTSKFGREEKERAGKAHRGSKEWVSNGFRNKRSVWTVALKPFRGAHFATFPPDLIEPCILAGCPPAGVVLDPFIGAGTTAVVARAAGRHCIGLELNPDYCEITSQRLRDTAAASSS
jgi:DNA modification methylase